MAKVTGIVRNGPVVFRVDSSEEIGGGHFSRCMALAEEFESLGFQVLFACRFLLEVHQDLLRDISRKYFLFEGLPEAKICEKIDLTSPSLVIFDLFNISNDHHVSIVYSKKKYNCFAFCDEKSVLSRFDYTINVGLGAALKHFPSESHRAVLCGRKFALVGKAYRTQRNTYGIRVRRSLNTLLIALGAWDTRPVVTQILSGLAEHCLRKISKIVIVLGSEGDLEPDLISRLTDLGLRVEVYGFVSNMHDHYQSADLAIGAGGVSAIERCCLGLPTLFVESGPDQHEVIEHLVEQRVGIKINDLLSEPTKYLCDFIDQSETLSAYSEKAYDLIDGRGASRLAVEILMRQSSFKTAKLSDAKLIWESKYFGPESSRYYVSSEIPSLNEHTKWLRQSLESESRAIYLLRFGAVFFGHLVVDRIRQSNSSVEVSYYIAHKFRGRGFGKIFIAKAISLIRSLGVNRVYATVHRNNIASQNCLKANQFYIAGVFGKFHQYSWKSEG